MTYDLGEERIKHLEMIQSVIDSHSRDSFLLKGWAVTLTAAGVGIAINQSDAQIAWLTGIPVSALFGLDGLVARSQCRYRSLYDRVRRKSEEIEAFSMDASHQPVTWWSAASQAMVVGLYGVLVLVALGAALVIFLRHASAG